MEEEALLGGLGRRGHNANKYSPNPTRFRSTVIFLATALLSGTVFFIIIISLAFSRPSLKASSHQYLFGEELKPPPPETVTVQATVTETVYPPPPIPTLNVDGLLEMNLDELKDMVDSTNGYLARDWSLGLGWNNVRGVLILGHETVAHF